MPNEAMLRRLVDVPARPDESRYELTLVVCGASDLSKRAIANARWLCDAHLEGKYGPTVMDLQGQPATALDVQVLAAPTPIKTLALPSRKLVGDLSHTERVVSALGLPAGADTRIPTG